MPGQVIIISGTSGSGKSTTAKSLVSRSDDFFLLFGIDQFLAGIFPTKFSHHGPRAREGFYRHHEIEGDPNSTYRWSFGEPGWKAMCAFHEMAASVARSGVNIIFDHLMFTDPPLLQDCIWRFKDLPVLFVALKPPYEVLLERIRTRQNERPVPSVELLGQKGLQAAIDALSKLTPWFYEASYKNDCYDLTIDTVKHGPDEVCRLIEERMAQGPGKAFELLRRRYPQQG